MGAAPLLVKVCGGGNKNKVLCHGMIRATGGTRFIGTGKQWENAANYLTLSKTTIELIYKLRVASTYTFGIGKL